MLIFQLQKHHRFWIFFLFLWEMPGGKQYSILLCFHLLYLIYFISDGAAHDIKSTKTVCRINIIWIFFFGYSLVNLVENNSKMNDALTHFSIPPGRITLSVLWWQAIRLLYEINLENFNLTNIYVSFFNSISFRTESSFQILFMVSSSVFTIHGT